MKEEMSEVLKKSLDELECVQIEWTASEIHLKDVQGRMILYLKGGHSGNA